jgi:hypothetical protein
MAPRVTTSAMPSAVSARRDGGARAATKTWTSARSRRACTPRAVATPPAPSSASAKTVSGIAVQFRSPKRLLSPPIGFEGKHCETEVDDCRDVTCLNQGLCLDLRKHFHCVCAQPFGGPLCAQLDPRACLADAHSQDLHYWRLPNASLCAKHCVCDSEARLLCRDDCSQTTDDAICRHQTTNPRLVVRLSPQTPLFCQSLRAIHSLIANSRDFCCDESEDGVSAVVHSPAVSALRRYLRALDARADDPPSVRLLWTLVAALVVSFVALSALLLWRKRRRKAATNQTTVNCIQNNLKDANRARNATKSLI